MNDQKIDGAGLQDQENNNKAATFLRRIRSPFSSPSHKRLGDALPVFQAEFQALKYRDGRGQKGDAGFDWGQPAENLFNLAKAAHQAGDTERGWRLLKAADRFTWYGLEAVSPELVVNRAEAIANEATDENKGLPKWRRDSIKGLLKGIGPKDCQCSPETVNINQVIEAKRLLDEHQDNVYHRLNILRIRLEGLFVIGLMFLLAWFLFLPPVPANLIPGGGSGAISWANGNPARFWGIIVLAGILGSLISSFTSAIGSDVKKSNIPAELSTLTITFARLMVASLSAVAITLLVSSGVLVSPQVTDTLAIALAIVAGFSDRLLLSAIEKAVKIG